MHCPIRPSPSSITVKGKQHLQDDWARPMTRVERFAVCTTSFGCGVVGRDDCRWALGRWLDQRSWLALQQHGHRFIICVGPRLHFQQVSRPADTDPVGGRRSEPMSGYWPIPRRQRKLKGASVLARRQKSMAEMQSRPQSLFFLRPRRGAYSVNGKRYWPQSVVVAVAVGLPLLYVRLSLNRP